MDKERLYNVTYLDSAKLLTWSPTKSFSILERKVDLMGELFGEWRIGWMITSGQYQPVAQCWDEDQWWAVSSGVHTEPSIIPCWGHTAGPSVSSASLQMTWAEWCGWYTWDLRCQRNLDKLKQVHGNLIRFNKNKWKVLHLGWGNPPVST